MKKSGWRNWVPAMLCAVALSWTRTLADIGTVNGVKWSYDVSDGTTTVTGAEPAEGRLSIPSQLGGCPVADIGSWAFSSCEYLTGVVVPGSVTNIGDGAFNCCIELTNVAIGNGVTGIGSSAFEWCWCLSEVKIPGSVAVIGDSAFGYCERLTNVVIGNGVAAIGTGAFQYCTNLMAVSIPDSVAVLGKTAFQECRRLTSVATGSGLEHIQDVAFANCTALTNVVMGAAVTNIGYAAFSGCTGLEELVIPSSVRGVARAFEGCGLKRLYVPASWEGTEMLSQASVPPGCTVVCGLAGTAFSVPAGGMAAVSVPYVNPRSGDGFFRFGETGIAGGLPVGSCVYFWDEEKQKWGGGMKSAFGWDSAEANRVLAAGEGFCVRNGGTEAVTVRLEGLVPSGESRSRSYAGGGAWTAMAHPYPCGEGIRFGDTELALQLQKGASVLFWEPESQGWSGWTKSAKGWPASAATRVLADGEAFFVRDTEDGTGGVWEAAKP